jgi:hypothetical protein
MLLGAECKFNGYGEQSSQDTRISGNSAVSWSLTRDNTGRIATKIETVAGQTFNYSSIRGTKCVYIFIIY